MTDTSTSTVRYIKQAKFGTVMFVPIHICNSHNQYFKIKTYNNNDYVFIKRNNINAKKQLICGATYSVTIKSWVHSGFVCCKYHLTLKDMPIKQPTKCLFTK